MKENWYALCVSILTNNSSESSLILMDIRPKNLPKKDLHLTEKQALNLKYLNKSMTWNEIAEEFGIYGEALRQQVSAALKKATKEPTKVSEVAMRKNTTPLYHTNGGMQIAN